MEEIEVLDLIDNLNTAGKLEYNDYSELHDAVGFLISDHKAVVETMQNKIDELEKENRSLRGANETMNLVINSMEDFGV